MAIKSVKESWRERPAEGGVDGFTCVRTFDVEFDTTDNPIKRPLLAWNASGIPDIWDLHPHNFFLYVKSKNVDATESPFVFKVRVNYTVRSTSDITDQQPDPFINPLDQPPEVEWTFAAINEPIDRDIDDKPILNSAGESPDPPVTREVSDLLLRIVRNEAVFYPLIASEYKDSVNDTPFLGFSAGFVKCTNFSARKMYAAQLIYWQVTYEFQIRLQKVADINHGWKLRVLDQGYRQLNEAGTNYVNIKDEEDNPISQPWPLDGNGHALSITAIQAGVAAFREFEIYPRKNFNLLGL